MVEADSSKEKEQDREIQFDGVGEKEHSRGH